MDATPILLIGCGGHGRVVLDTALMAGLSVSGILDVNLAVGEKIFGVPVLGGDEVLKSPEMAGASLLIGIGANPDMTRRRTTYESLSRRFEMLSLQHPSTVASRRVEIGKGVQIMAGAVVQNGTSIGDNSVVNTGARVDHDCKIDKHCFLAPGATLCGGVTLDDSVFVGAAATILPGIKVGRGAVIGAGSIVTQDVSTLGVLVGNPAREIRRNAT